MEESEHTLVEALRAGDEAAFERVVTSYQHRLMRVARLYVRTDAQAHDVVQDTWLGVLRGLAKFERRSSFKTWLFHILANRARTHAVREGRLVPFAEGGADDGTSEAGWFDARGQWAQPPAAWPVQDPEAIVLGAEARDAMMEAIAALPEGQRAVVLLRDVEGLEAREVCNVLEISETNQRVLLHRGRTKLRAALADVLGRTAR